MTNGRWQHTREELGPPEATLLLTALQCSRIKSVVELGHVMVITDLLLLLAGDVELNPGPGINDEPSDKDLMNNVAAKIPAKWHEFGVQLNIPTGTLDAVRRHTAQECFIEVFSIWKRSLSCEPISWVTVIAVLESPSIDEKKLAADLRAKYGTDTNTPGSSTSSSTGDNDGAKPSLHKLHYDRDNSQSCRCWWWTVPVVILVIGVICSPLLQHVASKLFNQTTTLSSVEQTTFSTKGHSNNAIPSNKPTCHPIKSMESQLPLPVITDPVGFCTCLNLQLNVCHQIAHDYPKVNEQTREIVFKWYNRQTNPCWEEFVGALVHHGSVRDAKQIADANGVDWKPFQEKLEET